MMKKITLLFTFAVAALNVAAVDYPTAWYSLDAACAWTTNVCAPAGFGDDKEAEAYYFGEIFYGHKDDPMFGDLGTFEDIWDLMPGDGYEVRTSPCYVHEGASPLGGPGVDYEFAMFKVGYDDDNIYVFMNYLDYEIPNGRELIEVAVSPYIKLETMGPLYALDGSDWTAAASHFRYRELGAYKITANSDGVEGVMVLLGEHRTAEDSQAVAAELDIDLYSHTDGVNNPMHLMWIVRFPIYSLTDYREADFDYPTWAEANDGKGISFDIKIKDNDTGDSATGASGRDYWWSSDGNNGFFSTSYSGTLKPGPRNAAEKVNAQPSNIKVASTAILLTEPADITIVNMLGIAVLSKTNATELSIEGLAKGAYMAVSGNEVVKFVK